MEKNIHINANDSSIRITKAIANINKKYIVGNSNVTEKQEWQQVITKLSSLLDIKNTNIKPFPPSILASLPESKIEDTPIDFSNVREKCFPKLNIYKKLNINFKASKNQPSTKVKIAII